MWLCVTLSQLNRCTDFNGIWHRDIWFFRKKGVELQAKASEQIICIINLQVRKWALFKCVTHMKNCFPVSSERWRKQWFNILIEHLWFLQAGPHTHRNIHIFLIIVTNRCYCLIEDILCLSLRRPGLYYHTCW